MWCVQAIAKVTEFLRQQTDDKMTAQACFIDLKKAFDTLDHEFWKTWKLWFHKKIH